ncbi:MAG: glycosyltransferase family 1 protein [Saprospiraceae bacterium]
MKIYYEAKRVFYNNTGLGNYSRWLVEEYSAQYPSDELFLLKPGSKESKHDLQFSTPRFNTISYSNFLGIPRMLSLLNKVPADGIFHGLSAEIPMLTKKIKKVIVTIHDIIFLYRPNDYAFIDRNIYIQKLKYALKNADNIIAISETTAQDIINYFGIDENKIKVIYQNCNKIFYNRLSVVEIEQSKIKFNLPIDYLICVSSFNERKNLQSIVEAYRLLTPSQRVPLVFVGSGNLKKDVSNLVAKYDLAKYFIFLDYVEPKDLPALYQGSMALIYPSLMEGFGIPALEAMASGIPILGHQHTAVEEAAGEAGLFVDCTNSEVFAGAIQNLQTKASLREKFKNASLVQLEKYTNAKLMKELNELYKS